MDLEKPGMSVPEVMAALRSNAVLAIAKELEPIVDGAQDRELAERIAKEAALAAARAIEPAFERMEAYLAFAFHTMAKLKEAEAAIQRLLQSAGARYN